MQYDIHDRNSTSAIVVVFYRNLSSYLPERFVTKKGVVDVEYQLISSMIGVHMKDVIHGPNPLFNVKVKLSSFNYTVETHTGWNISCAMVDFSQGSIKFSSSGCEMLWTSRNVTLCNCHKLGTYALLLTHYTPPVEISVHSGYEVVAGAGCAICAFLILLTFFILLSFWRKIKGAITALKLQVCIALLGTYGVFFCGLDGSLSQDIYPYTVTVIQFFLLTAFSLQLCIGLTVYVECIDLKDVYFSPYKITAIGWAVPVIVLGATLAAQSLEGFALDGWWLILGSNFFYAYTFSIAILTLFQVILFMIVKAEIRNYGKVSDLLQKKKVRINSSRLKLLHRSLMITAALLLVSLASILYVNIARNRIFEYFFSSSSAVLGLVVFSCYTICSEKHFLLCCFHDFPDDNAENEETVSRSRSNSFKSFLKPEIIDDTYTNKLKVDIEKRKERIESMYNQIERTSLSKEMGKGKEYLVSEGVSNVDESTASWPMDEQPSKCSPHSVTRSDFLRRNSGNDCYIQADWTCGDYSPHACEQSLLSTDPYSQDFSDCDTSTTMYQAFLDCESEAKYSEHSDRFQVPYMGSSGRCGGISSNSNYPNTSADEQASPHSVSTFQSGFHAEPSTSVHNRQSSEFSSKDFSASDLVSSQNTVDDCDDQVSLKNSSCFLRRTDSLETVVYCGKTTSTDNLPSPASVAREKVPSSAKVATNTGRKDSHKGGKSPLWNMTTV